MKIKAESLVEMLKKMDEVENKAGIAFSTSSEEDLQIALEKMRELRAMLYSLLATVQEEPDIYPITYPVIVPYRQVPWWEQVTCTCKSTSGKSWDSGTSSSATGAT